VKKGGFRGLPRQRGGGGGRAESWYTRPKKSTITQKETGGTGFLYFPRVLFVWVVFFFVGFFV